MNAPIHKELTVLVTVYDDDETIIKILNHDCLMNNKYFDTLIINDGYKTRIEHEKLINLDINKGKFWAVVESCTEEFIHSKYFLIIDPDDLFLNSINWKKLEKLSNQISKLDKEYDYFINTYTYYDHLLKKKGKKFLHTFIKVFMNCNTIYSTQNIKSNAELLDLKFLGNKQTYFEDKLLLSLTMGEGRNKKIKIPFYKYNKNYGITSNKTEYKEEIISAFEIMHTIKENLNSNKWEKKYFKYNYSRVKLLYDYFSK